MSVNVGVLFVDMSCWRSAFKIFQNNDTPFDGRIQSDGAV